MKTYKCVTVSGRTFRFYAASLEEAYQKAQTDCRALCTTPETIVELVGAINTFGRP